MLRVSAANILYAFIADILEECCKLNKLFMVENPRGSVFWYTTAWAESPNSRLRFFSEHQACAYGSKRPKCTRLAANFLQVETIVALCPGNHQQEPWGFVAQGSSKRVFATVPEKHYPLLLCEAIVHAFVLRLGEMVLEFSIQTKLQHAARAAHSGTDQALQTPAIGFSFFCENRSILPG